MGEQKTALVLSAGGLFGAYQAGAWEELSRVFSPDIVVGASVGSLNGWMIASSCAAPDITSRWRDSHRLTELRWRMPGTFSEGLIDSLPLENWVREMCGSWIPQREYGVVLTDFRTLKPRLFRGPDVTWEHVAASCAVPGFLRIRRIEGRLCSDGGLVDPLPLWAAVEMGATTIVAVNLLKHRPWFVRQTVKALRCYSGYRPCSTEQLQLVEICPSGRMGSGRESMYWSDTNNERWIESGRRDAREKLGLVVECLQRHSEYKRGSITPCHSIASID